MIWLAGDAISREQGAAAPGWQLLALAAVMTGVLLGVWIWCGRAARRLTGRSLDRDLNRFNRISQIIRGLIPTWFAVGVFFCSWPTVVRHILSPLGKLPLQAPGLIVGTLPAFAVWVLMWCAMHPAKRAIRELTMLDKLEADLPLRTPPTFWQYLVSNFRMQILMMFSIILCITLASDLLTILVRAMGVTTTDTVQLGIDMMALASVLLVSPILLVRVLPTQRLPDSPLRRRLEELCRDHRLKARDILLWKTHSDIGNAAVIGVLPGIRYVLVSDLILESMDEDQILAVFAHETGHIVHRHVWWFAVCSFGFTLAASGPGTTLWHWLSPRFTLPEPYASLASLALAMPLFFAVLGLISRRFERQADVFAARTMPRYLPKPVLAGESLPAMPTGQEDPSFVLGTGASIVCSALDRVAMINNIPTRAHEWLHGSIAWRINYLMEIADIPNRTRAFDTSMKRVYTTIIGLTLFFGAWTAWVVLTT